MKTNLKRAGLAGFSAAAALMAAAPARAQEAALDSGDTAWMLTSTAIVLMMTIPGLALFYGGMVRKKNVLAMAMQSFAIACLITIVSPGALAGRVRGRGCGRKRRGSIW